MAMTHDLLARSYRLFLFDELEDYAKAIESLPTHPIPYINRGYLYERAGRLHEAIDDYTQATVIKGDDATFHRCRAHACFATSQLQEAINSFNLRLGPPLREKQNANNHHRTQNRSEWTSN
jgi:tetratricopeptide (TPR) repeat protein